MCEIELEHDDEPASKMLRISSVWRIRHMIGKDRKHFRASTNVYDLFQSPGSERRQFDNNKRLR